jgi:hypothetical protein
MAERLDSDRFGGKPIIYLNIQSISIEAALADAEQRLSGRIIDAEQSSD